LSTVRRIAKNTVILLMAQGISYLLAFFYIVYTARYLGPAGYGVISIAIAITGIYSVMADFGTHQLMTREIARDREKAKQFLVNISIIKLVLVTVVYGIMAVAVNILGYPQQTIMVIYLLGLSVIFSTFYSMYFCVFQAYERMEFQAFGLIVNTLVMLAGVFIAISLKADVAGFAVVYIAAAAVVLAYCLAVQVAVFGRKITGEKTGFRKLDTSGIKNIIKQCWPIGVMAVLVVVRLKVDTILLSVFGGDKAVGLYNSAYRFVDISAVVPAMLILALFPTLSFLYSASPERFDAASSRAFKFLLFLALPLVFVVIMFAGPLVNLTFGSEYTPAVLTLQILICTAGVMFMSTLTGTLFITADKQSASMVLATGILALNLILNLILIPLYSQTGAAITAFATEFIGLVAGIIVLTKMGHKLNILVTMWPALLAVAIVAAIMLAAQLVNMNRILLAIISLAAYAIIIYRFGIDKEDIALVKELYNSPKA
jgi:O-antigen/teichoic acid export membrane protein